MRKLLMAASTLVGGILVCAAIAGEIVLSEPLDELNEHWEAVPESAFLVVENGKVTINPFTPI